MEQNIDDILKLLKDSVSAEQTQAPMEKENKRQKNISTEALQAQLKDQYIFDASDVVAEVDTHSEAQGEYIIDSDFLNEALRESDVAEQDDTALPHDGEERLAAESVIEKIEFPVVDDEVFVAEDQKDYEEKSFSPVLVMEQEEETADEQTDDVLVVEDDITEELEEAEEFTLDEIYEPSDDDDEELPIDNTEELIAALKPIEEEAADTEALADEEWELPEDNVDELIAAPNPIEESVEEEIVEDIVEEEVIEHAVFDEVTSEQEAVADDAAEEFVTEENVIEDDIDLDDIELINDDLKQTVEAENIPKVEEPHETFLASMRRTGMDFTTEDIYNSTHAENDEIYDSQDASFMEDATDDEVLESDSIIEEELDPSTINLMMQFCDKDELEDTIGDKRVDEFLKQEHATVSDASANHVTDGREYVDHEQTERIRIAYKKKRTSKLISLLGCSLIALVALIYEILPLAGVRLSGVLDHHKYPAVYALIGLQLVVFAGAVWHKELWRGLKRAFSTSPTPNSAIALILTLTAIYDAIIVIILAFTGDDLPYMYNGIAVLITAIAILSEYLDTVSQMRAFGVYSSESQKYTLIKESASGSVGSKMYGGGLEKDKSIYTIKPVEFPSGFFRSISATAKKNKIMTACIIPVLVVGMIASVIAILIGSDAYAACAAFMVCVYALMPVMLVLTNSLPYAIACKRLSKRGSAFAGQGAIDKYSDCDVMVFNDLHMFKKCRTEDIGIVIYDNKVGYLVLGCLDALYSKAGGPMSGLQMKLPDVFKFDDVAIKRMTRNGIEAVIDKKHTLIVGEQSFMQRYGLEFPPNGHDNGRATLCVSLDGRVTAKLSVRYETEPVFEMLAERLYSEGISCAVQTFDPLISSGVISASRTIGDSPISVIHGNAKDFCENERIRYNADSDGVISCASRLKLAEVEVWLIKLAKARRICERIALGFSIFGAIMLMLLVSMGATAYVNQIHILLYLSLEVITAGTVIALSLPSKKYFTTDALYGELERADTKKRLAEQRAKAKQAKKAAK